MKPFGVIIFSLCITLLTSLTASAAPRATDRLPTRLLTCGGGIIQSIGPRLEGGDYNAGTSLSLTNGGVSVSYDRIQPILDSRVGDHVLVCLVGLPGSCPPGDDRGKIYTMTNLRTLESWTLPDAQHSCGGA